ncbi:hypothetical protein [Paenibacillus endoradicis]|uniref:hypothetical protein n=1 Tax=Paenibacillus endoradicis TaxID=2972487 RepID=UPI002158BB2F|nr:hypothetical protein [Paenibacillus endoradicis]MCR8656740.1 hypothetical protein [Paenibacillus endoradicis]
MMDYRRISLNIIYGSFILWVLGFILSQLVFILSFPMLMVYLMIYPYGAILLAIVLLIAGEKWLSEERIMAFVLLIPIMILIVIPYAQNQINVHLLEPNIQKIESHIDYRYLNFYPSTLDNSPQLIEYDRDSKLLTLNMIIVPMKFTDSVKGWEAMKVEDYPSYFINLLRIHYIRVAEDLEEVTLKADNLIINGYWGDKVIIQSYFKKEDNKYILVEPYPDLALVGENNKWYLEYEVDNVKSKVFVLNRSSEDFIKKIEILN